MLIGAMIPVTSIIFPSIMIIILISPGITPVHSSYPYFTDEVAETPKVNCLPRAISKHSKPHSLQTRFGWTSNTLASLAMDAFASLQRRKITRCLGHRGRVLMNSGAMRSAIVDLKSQHPYIPNAVSIFQVKVTLVIAVFRVAL